MPQKIRLGRLKTDAGTRASLPTSADGEVVYLEKHHWDCGWYWAFGHIGNRNCLFHFASLLYIKDDKGVVKYEASALFSDTPITDKEWWVIRDLFVQAYALKKAAEVYRYGGHQTTLQGVTDLIRSEDLAARLNKDLETVLDTLWDFICKAVHKK